MLARRLPVERIAKRLGSKKPIRSSRKLSEFIEVGIPSASIDSVFADFGKPSSKQLVLQKISPTKDSLTLAAWQGEVLERVARVIELAIDVWDGDMDGASEFLETPNEMLGGDIPLHLALTEYGARDVEDLLLRAAYGIAS